MVVKGKNLVCADRECGTVIPLPEGDEAFA
jgi:hypothetical protein